MNYETITGFDVPSAWRQLVKRIDEVGDMFEVKEGSECEMTKKLATTVRILHPEVRPLVDDKCITTNMQQATDYFLRYLWLDAQEEGEDYTYGSRLNMGAQLEDTIRKLAREPNNRQITMMVRLPSDTRLEHPPCLSILDFDYVDGLLHMQGYFRSWDAFAGFPENVAGLQMLNEGIVKEVNAIRDKRGLPIIGTGQLMFHSKNAHLYERQWELVKALDKGDKEVDK